MRRRRLLFAGLGLVLALGSSYLIFELGRHQAGYSLLERQREAERHRREAANQARTIDELKREIALLQTSRDIDRETYSQLERTLTELEARLQVQEEELAFYRGIISPPDGVPGLRVQSLEIGRGNGEHRYALRLVLMQAIAQNRRVSGVVRLHIAGTRDGSAERLALPEISGEESVSELAFDFRYFQGLEQELELPAGFEPSTVEIEVRSSEQRSEPLTQSFEWAAVSGGAGPED